MKNQQIPFNNFPLSSLAEDMRVLNLLPPEHHDDGFLTEAKNGKSKKKKDKDYDDDYDYGDEMKEEAKSKKMRKKMPKKDMDYEDDDDYEDSVEEAAQAVLEAFADLTEDEVDELDEEYIDAVYEAAEFLGVNLTERKRMTKSQIRKRQRARRKPKTGKQKLALKKRRKRRQRNPSIRRKEKKWKRRYGENGDHDGALEHIIERLNRLAEPLAQESDEVGYISDKLVEGYKSVFYSASELAEGIATDLSEGDFDKNDPRYELGVYFEGIAEDAASILDTIFEGKDVPMEAAVEDLQGLTRDLRKGLKKAESLS